MLRIVDPAGDSSTDEIARLRAVIDGAYAQVVDARRRLAALPETPELSLHLQMAEADLVRAQVALRAIETPRVGPAITPFMRSLDRLPGA
jgi:hypothetical protein